MYFLEIGSADHTIREKYRNLYRVVHAGTKHAIKRGIADGIIREVDPSLAAFAVMGLVERVSETGDRNSGEMSLEKKAAQTEELVRHALANDHAKGSGSRARATRLTVKTNAVGSPGKAADAAKRSRK
jgi:hypothetical protein